MSLPSDSAVTMASLDATKGNAGNANLSGLNSVDILASDGLRATNASAGKVDVSMALDNAVLIRPVFRPDEVERNPMGIDLEGPYKNNALEGYRAALEQHKPLVLIMGNPYCGHCKALKAELEKPEMRELANKAIFCYTNPGDQDGYDRSGKAFADALDVRGYPTISVISPNPNKIVELARYEGYFPAQTLKTSLNNAIRPSQNVAYA